MTYSAFWLLAHRNTYPKYVFLHHYGPRPLNSTQRHGFFLNSTCDISLNDMRHGGKKDSDMRHGYFLNSTSDMVEDKQQRHATLPFHKIDMQHWGPPIKGPLTLLSPTGGAVWWVGRPVNSASLHYITRSPNQCQLPHRHITSCTL